MSKNTTINLRVNSEVKEQVGLILDEMGLTFSDAFNIFLHQVRIRQGLPFSVVAYNPSPRRETRDFINGIERGDEEIIGPFNTKEDLWESLDT